MRWGVPNGGMPGPGSVRERLHKNPDFPAGLYASGQNPLGRRSAVGFIRVDIVGECQSKGGIQAIEEIG